MSICFSPAPHQKTLPAKTLLRPLNLGDSGSETPSASSFELPASTFAFRVGDAHMTK